jgi:hypothetical protein
MGYDSTMQYNVGVQDKLLQDEGNSLFVHPGYTKCSLSQQSLSDLTPTQSTKHFGNVVKFLIPSMADLLGPVDLMLELNKAVDKSDDAGTHDDTYVGWVESLGYAMIDYASLHIGQNEIERISGDQMQLMNELMTSDKAKQIKNVGTTGRSLVALKGDQVPLKNNNHARTEYKWANKHYKSPRLVLDEGKPRDGMKLCVPLPFFFTKGPQDYLPLAMFSGCQNITVEVRLRPIEELLIRGCYRYNPDKVTSYYKSGSKARVNIDSGISQEYYHRGDYMPKRDLLNSSDNHGDSRANLIAALIGGVGLYHRATKPMHSDTQPASTNDNNNKAARLTEITDFNNAGTGTYEHAMRPMREPNVTADLDGFGTQANFLTKTPPPVEWADGPIKDIKLRLHEVQTTSNEAEVHQNEPQIRLVKHWQRQSFNFTVPRAQFGKPVEIIQKMDLHFLHPVTELIVTIRKASEMNSSVSTNFAPGRVDQGAACKNRFAYHGGPSQPNIEAHQHKFSLDSPHHVPIHDASNRLQLKALKLNLNGQQRNANLPDGTTREYMLERLLPMLHSNTSSVFQMLKEQDDGHHTSQMLSQLAQLWDRKEIYVFPFSLAPESKNPTGTVNFHKVAHKELTAVMQHTWMANETDAAENYVIDVYGVNYNWLQLEAGRAFLTFSN